VATLPPTAAVIEGKGTEVLGDQDGGIALALVRAKGARRHHPTAAKPERQAEVVELWHELAVTYCQAVYFQVAHHAMH
jgi:hypothetical protein